jgi:hypothetical protein
VRCRDRTVARRSSVPTYWSPAFALRVYGGNLRNASSLHAAYRWGLHATWRSCDVARAECRGRAIAFASTWFRGTPLVGCILSTMIQMQTPCAMRRGSKPSWRGAATDRVGPERTAGPTLVAEHGVKPCSFFLASRTPLAKANEDRVLLQGGVRSCSTRRPLS